MNALHVQTSYRGMLLQTIIQNPLGGVETPLTDADTSLAAFYADPL